MRGRERERERERQRQRERERERERERKRDRERERKPERHLLRSLCISLQGTACATLQLPPFLIPPSSPFNRHTHTRDQRLGEVSGGKWVYTHGHTLLQRVNSALSEH